MRALQQKIRILNAKMNMDNAKIRLYKNNLSHFFHSTAFISFSVFSGFVSGFFLARKKNMIAISGALISWAASAYKLSQFLLPIITPPVKLIPIPVKKARRAQLRK